MKTDIKDMYKIIYNGKKIKPKYVLDFEMDSNDADYIRDYVEFSEQQWNNLPEFFFLMLAYLDRGYSGKFSHGERWDNYYGHHWEDNKHGFANMIEAFADKYQMMLWSELDMCHSFSSFDLKYYDSNSRQYNVTIPNIDNMFKTEEEMISEMNRSYEEWKTITGYIGYDD